MVNCRISANIIFNKPAKLGDRLTATARVLTEGKRTATCEVVVTNQAGLVSTAGFLMGAGGAVADKKLIDYANEELI